jgi:hypothetical protein
MTFPSDRPPRTRSASSGEVRSAVGSRCSPRVRPTPTAVVPSTVQRLRTVRQRDRRRSTPALLEPIQLAGLRVLIQRAEVDGETIR